MSSLGSPNHPSDLVRGLSELKDSQDLFDITVIVGGKSFRAHKVVLAALSGYFKVMFTNPGFVDMKKPEIEIKEEKFTSASFQLLLDYMYTGSVQTPSNDGLVDMLQLAWFLQIQGAVDLCVKALSAVMQSQEISFDFVYYLCHIAMQMDCESLKSQAYRCICLNLIQFLQANSAQLYEQMSKGFLEELLKREDLNLAGPEEEILEVVVRWLQFDMDGRKCDMEALLKNIRLGTIPDHLLKEILSDDMYSVAQNLLKEHKVTLNLAGITVTPTDEPDKDEIKAKQFDFLKNVLMKEMLPPQAEDPIIGLAVNISAATYTELDDVDLNADTNLNTIKTKLESDSYSFVPTCLLDFKKYFDYIDHVTTTYGYKVDSAKHIKAKDLEKLFYRKVVEMPEGKMYTPEGYMNTYEVIKEKTLWTHRGTVNVKIDGLGVVSFQIVQDGELRQGFRLASFRDIRLCTAACVEELTAVSHLEEHEIYPFERNEYGRNQYGTYDYRGHGSDGEEEDVGLKVEDYKNTKYQMLTTLPRFLVAKNSQEIPGWELAKYAEVDACHDMVKTYLSNNRLWYICRLDGGRVAGEGYNYELKTEDSATLGHKLLIQYPCSFSVIKCGQLLTGWSIATYEEVENNLDLVKSLLTGKKADYECLVLGGKLRNLELEQGMFMGLEYQIVVQKKQGR